MAAANPVRGLLKGFSGCFSDWDCGCAGVLTTDPVLDLRSFFLLSDFFYLRGDYFKALDFKNDLFYLVRN